jgi:hypothetical protein
LPLGQNNNNNNNANPTKDVLGNYGPKSLHLKGDKKNSICHI